MKAINSDALLAIQGLRKHRNDLAYDLVNKLDTLKIESYQPLLDKANKALLKLSNYRAYMEIGDSEFQNKSINWNTAKGQEYIILEEVLKKVRILQDQRR
jgi:hypothetical protein